MAYQSVGNTSSIKVLSKMAKGDAVEGFLVAIEASPKYQNSYLVKLQQADGSVVSVASAGKLNYIIKDALSQSSTKDIFLGYKTRIVNLGTYTTRTGKIGTAADLQQDREVLMPNTTPVSVKKAGGLPVALTGVNTTTAPASTSASEADARARIAELQAQIGQRKAQG